MAFRFGGKTTLNGLALYLDAANLNSYPGSGTAWNDLSPNVSNSTLTNGPTYSSNNLGTILFDGVNDYVDTGNRIISLAPTLPITIEMWIYINAGSSDAGITLDVGNPLNYYGVYTSFANSANIISFLTSYGSGGAIGTSSRRTAATGANFTTDTWYHVVGITESTITNSKIYVNGISQALSTSGTGGALAWSGTGTGRIGGNWGAGTPTMNGRIAVAKVYSRALTQDEVSQNYNALKDRFGL